MSCAQGALSKLLVDSDATFDASSTRVPYLYESIKKHGRLIGARGMTGSRSQYSDRVREGSYVTGGRLSTYTDAKQLDFFLPRILGAAESSDVFDVANGLIDFDILIDRVGGVFHYTDCVVNRAVWKGAAGPGDSEPEFVEQILEVYATDEDLTTSWPTNAPDVPTGTVYTPYIMADGVLSIDSTPYQFQAFTLVVDNHIQPRFVNSITPVALCPQDRTVMLRVAFPFDSTLLSAIYQHANRLTGVSASITFTPSGIGTSTEFAFEGLQWAQQGPIVQGKREITITLDFIARKTGSASEIVVTNDSV